MKYSDIRKNYQNHNYIMIVDPYVCMISPLITRLFLRTSITPNQVTVLMMLSGILGSIFFCLPNIIFKIIGILFIHTWYILDCCDGEIARINKKFSKFGKEIDYTAHIINHPLFSISFLISMIQMNIYEINKLIFIFIAIAITNLIFRNLLIFNNIYEQRMNIETTNVSNESNKINIKKKIMDNMVVYPNFALIFPIAYLIDLILNTRIAYLYGVIFMFTSFIIVSLKMVRWILKIVNE